MLLRNHEYYPLELYIRALDSSWDQQLNPACFLTQVKIFSNALRESSVTGSGKETLASNQVEEKARNFYRVWLSLDNGVRQKISVQNAEPLNKYTFEEILNRVLNLIDPHILPAEKTINRFIINCAQVLSSILDHFCSKYQDDWAVTSIRTGESDDVIKLTYTTDSLFEMRQDVIDTLESPVRASVFPRTLQHSLSLLLNNQKLKSKFALWESLTVKALSAVLPGADIYSDYNALIKFLHKTTADVDLRKEWWLLLKNTMIKQPDSSQLVVILYLCGEINYADLSQEYFSILSVLFANYASLQARASLAAYCLQSNQSFNDVYRFFMSQYIKNAQTLPAGQLVLSACMLSLDVNDTDLHANFLLIAKKHPILMGMSPRSFLPVLAEIEMTQAIDPASFDKAAIKKLFYDYYLPELMSQQKLKDLWNATKTCGCLCTWMSKEKNTVDALAFAELEALSSSNDVDTCFSKMNILCALVQDNKGNQFMQAVKKHYGLDFLKLNNGLPKTLSNSLSFGSSV